MGKLFLFVLFLSAFGSLKGLECERDPTEMSREDRIECLDEEIQNCKDRRDLYKTKAAIAKDQGDRTQFERGESLIDAQRYWKKADEYDEMAAALDDKIEELEQERSLLLKGKK